VYRVLSNWYQKSNMRAEGMEGSIILGLTALDLLSALVVVAEIRHGYVHANRTRRKVMLAAPNLAIFQAWQLSLW
jgi:hypothetical protein